MKKKSWAERYTDIIKENNVPVSDALKKTIEVHHKKRMEEDGRNIVRRDFQEAIDKVRNLRPKTKMKVASLIYAMETELLGHCCSIFDARNSDNTEYRVSTNRVFVGIAIGGIAAVVNSFNKLCEFIDPNDIDCWEYDKLKSMFEQVDQAISRHEDACIYADVPGSQVERLEINHIFALKRIVSTSEFRDKLNTKLRDVAFEILVDPSYIEQIKNSSHRFHPKK